MANGRILVTGAAGFLGRHVVGTLTRLHYDVIAHVRTAVAATRFEAAGLPVLVCDLRNQGELEALGRLGPLDGVVHCAGLSSNWGPRHAFEEANVHATGLLLDRLAAHGRPHVLYVSSSSVYFAFRDQFDVRESMALPPPVNAYAWSKARAEKQVLAARHLPVTVLRPRGIYGRGDGALLPRLLRAAARGPLPLFRDGQAVIDLTHVEDVAAAIAAVLRAGDVSFGKTYNVSGGEPVAVRRIIEESAARVGTAIRWRRVPWPLAHAGIRALEALHTMFRPGNEPFVTAYSAGLLAFSQTLDLSAIRGDLGWLPAIRFAEGLERTFAGEAS